MTNVIQIPINTHSHTL